MIIDINANVRVEPEAGKWALYDIGTRRQEFFNLREMMSRLICTGEVNTLDAEFLNSYSIWASIGASRLSSSGVLTGGKSVISGDRWFEFEPCIGGWRVQCLSPKWKLLVPAYSPSLSDLVNQAFEMKMTAVEGKVHAWELRRTFVAWVDEALTKDMLLQKPAPSPLPVFTRFTTQDQQQH